MASPAELDAAGRDRLSGADDCRARGQAAAPAGAVAVGARSQQNVSTVIGTAQAGGIALAAARRDVDVHFHTPSEVKAAVAGNWRADKAQVTGMVTKILALQAKPTSSDAADALALAICRCSR